MENPVFPGALSALASGLVAVSLAASPSPTRAAPPEPPGPPRPVSQRVVIAPAPVNAPGRYFQHQPRANAYFSDTGLLMRLSPEKGPSRELGWGLVGAQPVVPQPLQPREALFNQLTMPARGASPGPHNIIQQGLPTWGALYYPEAAAGVDLWLESRESGVGYSLRAARGSQLARVWLEWRGAKALKVAEGGRALEVQLADGHLREEGLLCGQERKDGTSYEVPCRYREVRATQDGRWQYLIEVDVKEPGRPAWVDPVIQWNTFIGGPGDETLDGIDVIRGNVSTRDEFFVVGSSGNSETNTVAMAHVPPGMKLESGGDADVVITRFGVQGNIRWLTVLGGLEDDVGSSVVIGANNDIHIAGGTVSPNLQRQSATTYQGNKDGFVARIGNTGSPLLSFHYVGGTGDELINGLTLGPDGKLYAVGYTTSPSMPGTTGGTDGGRDMFISRFSDAGVLEKTLLRGGHNEDVGFGITSGLLPDGGIGLFVTGYTESPNFPNSSPPAQQASLTNRQVVVQGLNPQLNAPDWSVLIGGQGHEEGYKVLFTPTPSPGRVLVVGSTGSQNFPTLPQISQLPAGRNAFLTSFPPTGGGPDFSAVLGGSGEDEGWAIAQGTGRRQSIFIGGKTTSSMLPIGGGFDMTNQGEDGYVLRLVPNGTNYELEWGTFVGGINDDEVRALAVSDSNDLIIGGVTVSQDALQLQGPDAGFDTLYNGGPDMFVYSLRARDLTPPRVLQIADGVGDDRDQQTHSERLQASWLFQDLDSDITGYEVAVGTGPGCTNISNFVSLGDRSSVDLTTVTPGSWYFVTVRVRNSEQLEATVSTDGVFVTLPDGGPNPIPPIPTTCPTTPDAGVPDAGVPDGGGSDGGPEDGDPQSPVGCNCGTTGGPAGLVLLTLLLLGLRGSLRTKPTAGS